jgi:prepilin-type N-terminal cleavage/methylation domain-containing protein
MSFTDLASASARPSSTPRRRPRRGFQLLELVVCLVLIGIMTVISSSRISAMRAQQQVTRSASVIQTQMEKAFALAGRNRAPVAIVWNSTTMKLTVTDRAQAVVYGSTNLGSDFGLKSGEVTSTRSTTEVYPNGFAQDTLSITISTLRGGVTRTKRIRMSRAGLVKVI